MELPPVIVAAETREEACRFVAGDRAALSELLRPEIDVTEHDLWARPTDKADAADWDDAKPYNSPADDSRTVGEWMDL